MEKIDRQTIFSQESKLETNYPVVYLFNDEDVKVYCNKYLVQEIFLRKYLDHLKYLDINKKKKAEKKQLQNQQDNNL